MSIAIPNCITKLTDTYRYIQILYVTIIGIIGLYAPLAKWQLVHLVGDLCSQVHHVLCRASTLGSQAFVAGHG